MREIDWFEYERRKAKIQNIGLTSEQYEAAISRIVQALERDADQAKAHHTQTTDVRCSCCTGKLVPYTGYFDPRMIDTSESDPRKYEQGWRCVSCEGGFTEPDIAAC